MGQERLCDLVLLSSEYDIVRKLNFDDLIEKFAINKSRRVSLKKKNVPYFYFLVTVKWGDNE